MSFKYLPAAIALVASGVIGISADAQTNRVATEHIALLEQERSIKNIFNAYFPSPHIGRQAAKSLHGQLLETNWEQGYIVLELDKNEMSRLKKIGFKFKKANDFLQRREQFLDQMQEQVIQSQISSAQDFNPLDVTINGIPNYACYETVEESFAVAQDFATTKPNIAEWIDVGDSWEKVTGGGGYDIQVLKLTNKSVTSAKPKLFINSAIHAREYTTAALTLDFARWLVDGYGTNADATWILDNHEVHLMLQTNPDGRKKAETGISWRKNANQNYCGATSNSRGADLNRNFTFTWNITNGQGSSGSQCNATYRGPSPASEPEVQALEAYVRNLWPDRRGPNLNDAAPSDTSGIHLDIHSFSELVLWPWGATNQAAPNGTALQTLGRKFAFFNGYNPEQSIGLYATDGTSDAVSYGELGVAAYTFELGTSFFQACSTYENTIKPNNLPALIYAAKVVRTPYITPAGPDVTSLSLSNNASTSGVPAGTQVTLSASVSDLRFSSRNGTEGTQNINAAEYYINTPPWQSGAVANSLSASDGSYNEKTEGVTGVIDTTGYANGQYTIYTRSRDASGAWGAVSAEFLVIDDTPVEPPQNEYCSASGDNASEEWISGVSIGSFTNNSGSSSYTDFTEAAGGSLVTIAQGSTNITFTPQFSGRSYSEYWKAWIDLNSDGDFADAGEEVYSSGGTSNSAVSGSLSIPANAPLGKTRLRVAMRYNAAPSACGSFNFGEVEDYSVEVIAGGGPGPDPDPVSFENTQNFNIPDNNATGVSSPIDVTKSGASGTISVDVNIQHTYKGDLIVDLLHPDGTVFNLHNRTGGSANNIVETYSVNVGAKDSSGTWNLRVRDRANRDVGIIDLWRVTFP